MHRAIDTLKRRALPTLVVLIALAVPSYVFLVLNDQMTHSGVGYDETFFVWGGWCITKGLRPYADFIEFKPPFVFLTHALALATFGFDRFRYRIFFALFNLVALGAAHLSLLSRGVDKVLSTLLLIGFIALFVNPRFHDTALTDSESIGLAYYLLGVACLLARTARPRLRVVLDSLGGAFFLACAQSKEPFLPVAFASWITCFFARPRSASLQRDAVAYAKHTALGALVVAAALCIYMVPTGSMKAYLSMVRGYFTFYRDPKKAYCVLLGRFQPTTKWHDLAVQWDQARREFFNTDTLGPLFPFAAGTFAFTVRRNPALFLGALVSVFFGLYAVTASNCQWIHYYNMTMSGLFLFWAVGLDAVSTALRGSPRFTRAFVRVTVAGVVLFPVWPRFDAERATFGTRKFGTPYVEPVPGIFEVVAKHTAPADRIFTSGMPNLYVQTNRIGATRESVWENEIIGFYQGDTDEERFRPVLQELKKNMPKVFVLDPLYGSRKTRVAAAAFMPFLTSEHYTRLNDVIYLRPY